MNPRKVIEWGMHQGEWVRLDRGRPEADPRPEGTIDDEMACSIEKLKRTRDEVTKLAILADERDSGNRELESALVASRKLYQYVKQRMPFVSGRTNVMGSDFGPAKDPVAQSPTELPDDGFWMCRFRRAQGIAGPDPKDEGLTMEQKNFLARLRVRR